MTVEVDHLQAALLAGVGFEAVPHGVRIQRVIDDDEDATRGVQRDGNVEGGRDGHHLAHAGEPAARCPGGELLVAHAAEDDGHRSQQVRRVFQEKLQRRIIGRDDRRRPGCRIPRFQQRAHLREQLLAAAPGIQELDRQVDGRTVTFEAGTHAARELVGPLVADVVGVDQQDAARLDLRPGGHRSSEGDPQDEEDRGRPSAKGRSAKQQGGQLG